MPTFAAIDIGSNSCRLAIASVSRHNLKTLHEDREVVRLGESVFETGMISPDAMANTIRALKRFQKAVQTHVCDRVRVVATSAMRDARNSAAFIAWVKSTTGWDVDVISGLEEGRLIHLGVTTHEPGAKNRCLLMDLGGGSCEVTLSDRGRIAETVSLPLGAVRLHQEFLRSDPPTREEVHRLQSYIDREMKRADRKMGQPRVSLVIATSGTAAALAEIVAAPASIAVKSPKKRAVASKREPGMFVSVEECRLAARRLAKMSNAERVTVPGLGPKRSEIIVEGAMVYAELMERLGLPSFRYSPFGLRDGILAQMLADTDMRASVHVAVEEERWRGVLELADRYGVDRRHADRVMEEALKLFDALAKTHDLPGDYRFWLASAAMVHEVGKFMNHQGHHRHTQYIIANSEIYGFSPQQRAIVSAIARYMGKSRPEAEDRPMRAVPPDEMEHVRQCICLLRLAIALSQNRAAQTVRTAVKVYPRRVVIDLMATRGNADLELWAARKEAGYFREVFRRELLVEFA